MLANVLTALAPPAVNLGSATMGRKDPQSLALILINDMSEQELASLLFLLQFVRFLRESFEKDLFA
jgi:hypothetical protein